MSDTKEIKQCVLCQLPRKWQSILQNESFKDLEEIRFRLFLPVMLYYGREKKALSYAVPSAIDMADLLNAICKNSVYAYRENISQGFVTLSGGHRAGLCGSGVIKGGDVSGFSRISGINIRLARDICGCSKEIQSVILGKNGVKNALIISPPQAGKTTMLRDLARAASLNHKVCVIDERSEIAALSADFRGFDLGMQTDVYDGIPKKAGITMALRALSPEVIITDEIDTEADMKAVKSILGAGVKIIASVHSEDFCEFEKKQKDFLKLFDVIIVLSRRNGAGTIEEVRKVDATYS